MCPSVIWILNTFHQGVTYLVRMCSRRPEPFLMKTGEGGDVQKQGTGFGKFRALFYLNREVAASYLWTPFILSCLDFTAVFTKGNHPHYSASNITHFLVNNACEISVQ